MGWALAAAALVAGYLGWGWRGLVLGVTVVVFWLLLQFSRTLRAMQKASERPLGSVASAVMLHSQLETGMPLLKVIGRAGSLGRRIADTPETFAWTDGGGDAVHVELANGRVSQVTLVRA